MEVIKVENLYKQYRLGVVSTGSVAHDLNRWWHSVLGKEDPYEKITGLNNRDQAVDGDYVWALQDINFSIKQGEVLGIIGKNGAGKSTLLKILSKVTSPTKGSVKVKGRIASLLEVGTGFHPELTGRENIFLNGAILGMTKSEIRAKFDEIVAFSGVEKYIDTPVKRYSSGMYVRLAFAVAAHLEPEILIVDEVLAVGDAEFQKSCLGKMRDVSGEGRTVLFVSHNLAAVQSLCSRVIHIKNGGILNVGETESIIQEYLLDNKTYSIQQTFDGEITDKEGVITLITGAIYNSSKNDILYVGDDVVFEFHFNIHINSKSLNLSLNVYNPNGINVFNSMSDSFRSQKGKIVCKCMLPGPFLNSSEYNITLVVAENRNKPLIVAKELLSFKIEDKRNEESYFGRIGGVVRPNLDWEILKK